MPRYLYLHGQVRFLNTCLVKWMSAYYCQIETLGIEVAPENKIVFFSYLCPTAAASAVDAFTLDTKSRLFFFLIKITILRSVGGVICKTNEGRCDRRVAVGSAWHEHANCQSPTQFVKLLGMECNLKVKKLSLDGTQITSYENIKLRPTVV